MKIRLWLLRRRGGPVATGPIFHPSKGEEKKREAFLPVSWGTKRGKKKCPSLSFERGGRKLTSSRREKQKGWEKKRRGEGLLSRREREGGLLLLFICS